MLSSRRTSGGSALVLGAVSLLLMGGCGLKGELVLLEPAKPATSDQDVESSTDDAPRILPRPISMIIHDSRPVGESP